MIPIEEGKLVGQLLKIIQIKGEEKAYIVPDKQIHFALQKEGVVCKKDAYYTVRVSRNFDEIIVGEYIDFQFGKTLFDKEQTKLFDNLRSFEYMGIEDISIIPKNRKINKKYNKAEVQLEV
ncbi:MAG: hypothetical protein H7331_09195, partial [Bacteroidia bacterium]|nr:hypothetical protein [Bacteroidia bacterium]